MKAVDKCATDECDRTHTLKSAWCHNCRASLRRWINMGDAEREASRFRALFRLSRIDAFPSRPQRHALRLVARRRRH